MSRQPDGRLPAGLLQPRIHKHTHVIQNSQTKRSHILPSIRSRTYSQMSGLTKAHNQTAHADLILHYMYSHMAYCLAGKD